MHILVFQHTSTNPAGAYGEVARARGATTTVVELDQGEPIPSWAEFDGIIAMGGPMSVNDEEQFPWLRAEKQAIREAVQAGVPFWGACLGGQLLAASLGARVYRMRQPEIGFLPVDLSENAPGDRVFCDIERPFAAFQWHGDAFELPEGAIRLAGSKACANQVFRWGELAYGVQFHLEATVQMVGEWTQASSNRASLEGALGPGAAERLLDELGHHESEQRRNAQYLASRWIDQIDGL